MDSLLALKFIVSSIFVFFVPGYFIYCIFLKKLNIDFFQSLIISIGLSLSFIPLITYFFTLFRIKMNNFLVILLLFIFVVTIFSKYIFGNIRNEVNFFRFENFKNSLKQDLYYYVLLIIFIISILVRFIQVEGILVGPGSDSYHHTLIAQLIVENGGIPGSYEPYVPLASFTYHFGFHSIVAFLYWVSGISIIKLVIFTGQILNAFALLSVFIFVDRLFRNKNMALLSSFIVGLISIFPAYYVNWGRYTQLTGMVILPIALLLIIECIEMEKRDIKVLFISGFMISGLFLSHYRIIIAFSSFAILYLMYGIYHIKDNRNAILEILIRCFVIILIALILLFPWLMRLIIEPQIITASNYSNVSSSFFSIERIGDSIKYYTNLPLLLLSFGGIFIGVFKKNKYIILITLWISILISFSNPFWLKLPFSGSLDFVTVLTILYFPIAVTSSYFITYLLKKIKITSVQNLTIFYISLLILAPFSAINLIGTFYPENVFVKPGDIDAMNWIKVNTEDNATFLIESYSFDWSQELKTGIDGGYWIPLFTKRNVTIPPMTYLVERPYDKNYIEKVIAMSKAENSISSESAINFLIQNNVNYLYFGGRNWGNFKLENLNNNTYLRPVYNKDGVWIFKINRS
ncbi:MAG: DUF1616 domain-containing protein [Candidatus Methanoperedens sp.]|nr:DUF1616 domain-containing protein [Candidatus Methanoperedens sp.]